MHYSISSIPSPLGYLIALANETHLVMLEFADSTDLERKVSSFGKELSRSDGGSFPEAKDHFSLPTREIPNSILLQTQKELSEYFAGTRQDFDIPLAPHGTEFQLKAWQALEKIPYGETRNYGEEAKLADHPKAVRAIGGANNRNPIVIIIPCHRVIGADGSLTGYGGGIKRKKWLLEHEKNHRRS